MSTLRSEFVELASELIGDEFADFTKPAVINLVGSFDYATQAAAVLQTSSLPMIRLDYKQRQFDGQSIKIGDFMLIGERRLVSFEPRVDNCTATFDGKAININRVEPDDADASFILHCRYK